MITILIFHLIIVTQLYLVCRNKTVGFKELMQAFSIGATGVVLSNFVVQGIAARFIDSHTVGYTITPIAEEVFKIAFVAFLFYKTSFRKSASMEDGILLGLAAGAGFGLTEDTVRALGLGVSHMLSLFPNYAWSSIPKLLITWLPIERSEVEVYVSGHALWTALVGAGIGMSVKLRKTIPAIKFLPVILLLWVILDHSLVNVDSSSIAGISVDAIYRLYGYGRGITYVLTVLLVIAIVGDEWLLRKQKLDPLLLLPEEKSRSLFGELWLSLRHMHLGTKHWLGLLNYFALRRRYILVKNEQEDTASYEQLLQLRKTYVLASIEIDIPQQAAVSSNIQKLWQGPLFSMTGATKHQKFLLLQLAVLAVIMIFFVWFFFFSLAFPEGLVQWILSSPIVPIVGIAGYLLTTFHVIEFYRKKQWKPKDVDFDDRIKQYSDTILINSSGINTFLHIPSFFGSYPLVPARFLWGQIARYIDQFREIQQWVGGTVSAAIGFIPIVGNVHSGIQFFTGFDYVANERVSFGNRMLAGVGMIPILGNVVSGVRAVKVIRTTGKAINTVARFTKAGKSAQVGERVAETLYKARNLRKAEPFTDAVDYLASRYGLGEAVVNDYKHAYGEVRKALGSLDTDTGRALAQNRSNMLDQWSKNGGINKVADGHYQRNNVEVFVDQNGLKAMNPKGSLTHVGQVTVDHNSKQILFDDIAKDYAPGQLDTAASQIETLQKTYPNYNVLLQERHQMGFSQMTAVAPDGGTVSYWQAPTRFPSLPPSISSVSSR